MPKVNIELLQRRALLQNHLRQFFQENGYWEVETPLLSHDTCVDRWLDPFEVVVNGETCFLQTSPEFAMKRLLCRGADSIFQVCKSFRSGEIGGRHNPEFTMVEWYSKSENLAGQISFVESLITELFDFSFQRNWISSPRSFNFQQMTYEVAFQKYAGLSAFLASDQELLHVARKFGWTTTEHHTNDRDDLLNYILANTVEPQMQKLGGVSLTDYPASQSALARIRADEFPVAERFELYLDGVEICNGYQELTDPDELRIRMEFENTRRGSHGGYQLPVESHLLKEMKAYSLPECSGVALGFDRLVMLCLEQESLQSVIAFPFSDA